MSKSTKIAVEERLLFEDPTSKEANWIENQKSQVGFGDGSRFIDSINSARENSIVLEDSDVGLDVEWDGIMGGTTSVFEVVEIQVFNDMIDAPDSVVVENISVFKS